jgi:hypothetical protein
MSTNCKTDSDIELIWPFLNLFARNFMIWPFVRFLAFLNAKENSIFKSFFGKKQKDRIQ